jgi:hypothetical protein
VIAAPLVGCLILNVGVDLAASAQYRMAEAAGFGPVACGAMALVADTRTLCDLERAYGPGVAMWLPLGASLGTHVGAVAFDMPNLPAWASVIVSGLVWLLCREERRACSASGS